MVTASIVINQAGLPEKPPGEESRDDLSLGVPVVLSNRENSGVWAWTWTLLSKPPDSSAGLTDAREGFEGQPITPATYTCQFTPDVAGSYLIQLVLNGRVQTTAIAAVKTAYLSLRIPATGETIEFEGWEVAIQRIIGELEDGIQAGGGGGGTLDRCLVFSDDTQFAEAGGSFVTKKTFRIVRDSNKPPTSWRIVASLWGDSPSDSVECRVRVTGAGTDTITLPGADGTTETIVAGTLSIDGGNEPQNSLLTFEIQLRLAAGSGAANIQYTDVFAVYTAPGPE